MSRHLHPAGQNLPEHERRPTPLPVGVESMSIRRPRAGWATAAAGAGVGMATVVVLTFGASGLAAAGESSPSSSSSTSVESAASGHDDVVVDLDERRAEHRAARGDRHERPGHRRAEHLRAEGLRGDRMRAGIDAVAELLDMTPEDLLAELTGGSRLAEVAEARGVDTDTLVEAMLTGVRAHLDHHVATGELTSERADELLARATERTERRLERRAAFDGPRNGERWRD